MIVYIFSLSGIVYNWYGLMPFIKVWNSFIWSKERLL